MKKLVFLWMIIFSVTVFAADGDGNKLAIGDKALHTEVKMLDVSGEKVSLKDASKENGIVVLFSCNSCPFVLQWEDRYSDIKAWADKNDVGMIVLNSNHQKRDGDDSFEAMKKHASEKGYNFYYAVDENSLLANTFGGQTTPHAFVFDGNMELVYKGAIDDSYKSADSVKQAYLKEAVASLGSGEKVAQAETKPVGCSIKRKMD
jgi:hypothetical protein